MDFIKNFYLPKSLSIIDIGDGDSERMNFLLKEGYTDITVLDISEKALERANVRLGQKATRVQWIFSDITRFNSEKHIICGMIELHSIFSLHPIKLLLS